MAVSMHRRARYIPRAAHDTAWSDIYLGVLVPALLGLALSGLFSSLLKLPRDLFLAPYVVAVAAFVLVWARRTGMDLGQLIRGRLARGLVGAVVVGALMAASVLRQPASPLPEGWRLGWDLFWLGLVYGVADATLLAVVPIASTWRTCRRFGMTRGGGGRLPAGVAALAASQFVTAAYHLGFAEYRGPGLVAPLIGNGAMALGYLLFANPLTAVIAHVALHVTSVLHGVDTTVTLPPHY
jgi:hypothetical protein